MKPIALLLILLTACVPTQRMLLTDTQHRPGERSLVLTGLLQDADSAYIQVYHDGQEVGDQHAVGSFTLTLGAHTYYLIKLTDPHGRVKRIALHELSDDMIEFLPPIEVDFGTTGNLVLIKQRDGKPDWLEIDVGMSRREHR